MADAQADGPAGPDAGPAGEPELLHPVWRSAFALYLRKSFRYVQTLQLKARTMVALWLPRSAGVTCSECIMVW